MVDWRSGKEAEAREALMTDQTSRFQAEAEKLIK
jgi:hypothetical protein